MAHVPNQSSLLASANVFAGRIRRRSAKVKVMTVILFILFSFFQTKNEPTFRISVIYVASPQKRFIRRTALFEWVIRGGVGRRVPQLLSVTALRTPGSLSV